MLTEELAGLELHILNTENLVSLLHLNPNFRLISSVEGVEGVRDERDVCKGMRLVLRDFAC